MTIEEILKFLQEEIHTVVIASLDEDHIPITCAIDLMLVENHKIYFLMARGKALYQRLMKQKEISLTGIKGEDTLTCIAVTIQGKVRNIGHEKLINIFKMNPYMQEIYPQENAREVLEVFEIYEYQGELFDLSQKPIYRKTFAYHRKEKNNNYDIIQQCNGCLKCYEIYPVHAIIEKRDCHE